VRTLRPSLLLTLALAAPSIGCDRSARKETTADKSYAEALTVFNAERQELERLEKEKAGWDAGLMKHLDEQIKGLEAEQLADQALRELGVRPDTNTKALQARLDEAKLLLAANEKSEMAMDALIAEQRKRVKEADAAKEAARK
jgi:hypothetical protein